MSDLNKEYSYKDFTAKDLTKTDPKTWNDTEVIGTCFHQNKPKTVVFPTGITGVTFTKCNLDNVVVPKECTINGGCHRWLDVQNDGETWILDDNLNPIEPLNKAMFVKLGLSTSPTALTAEKATVPITQIELGKKIVALREAHQALDDAVDWR